MSDGNFNRALLPSTPYRSGFRMGWQQAKSKAVEALHHALEQAQPPLTEEQREAIKADFQRMLSLEG